MRLAFTLALFNMLAHGEGLQVDDRGDCHLSSADFDLYQ
jgi:hypothetical protein